MKVQLAGASVCFGMPGSRYVELNWPTVSGKALPSPLISQPALSIQPSHGSAVQVSLSAFHTREGRPYGSGGGLPRRRESWRRCRSEAMSAWQCSGVG